MVLEKKLSRMLHVYIRPDDIKLIEAAAAREQRSVSSFMRAAAFDRVRMQHADLIPQNTVNNGDNKD